MKKYIILITLLVLFLASCSDKMSQYTLTGTFADMDYNGKTVYLVTNKIGDVILDSTVVENNKFSFKGAVLDSVQLTFVAFDKMFVPRMFVVEAGNIKMTIDTVSYGSYKLEGTVLNNEYQAYQDRLWLLMQNSYKLADEMNAAPHAEDITTEEYKIWESKKDSVLIEMENLVYDFIEQYADNYLGEFVFFNDYMYMNPRKAKLATTLFRPTFDIKYPKVKDWFKTLDAIEVGQPYIDVKGFDMDGKESALSDYVGKGNVVLIDFWASWCGPCIASLPELKDFYEKNKDKGLVIVGVSLDNNKTAWKKATEKHNIMWPQLSNLKGYDDPAAVVYDIKGIPCTILIDKEGIIAGRDLSSIGLQKRFDELVQ